MALDHLLLTRTSCYTTTSNVMSTPFSPECMKERSMAKAKHPRRRHGNPVRPCAWCANPVHGDAVTVTFPDKEQATFHVACLYQYRAVMWPWAAR